MVCAGGDRGGMKREHLRADRGPFDLRRADLGGGENSGQVLPHQAGFLAAGADALDAEGLTRDERKAEGGAQDLPAPFACRAIDF